MSENNPSRSAQERLDRMQDVLTLQQKSIELASSQAAAIMLMQSMAGFVRAGGSDQAACDLVDFVNSCNAEQLVASRMADAVDAVLEVPQDDGQGERPKVVTFQPGSNGNSSTKGEPQLIESPKSKARRRGRANAKSTEEKSHA